VAGATAGSDTAVWYDPTSWNWDHLLYGTPTPVDPNAPKTTMQGGLFPFLRNNQWVLPVAGMGVAALMNKPASSLPGYGANVSAADYLRTQAQEFTNAGLPTITNTAQQLATQGQQLTSAGLPVATTAMNTELTSGQALETYMTTGQLPPGLEAGLQQAQSDALASLRSKAAAAGTTVNPEDEAAIYNQTAIQRASIAQQLFTTGAGQIAAAGTAAQQLYGTGVSQEEAAASLAANLVSMGFSQGGLSTDIYNNIMRTQLAQDQSLQQAITSLAGAAARPTYVNQGGTIVPVGTVV
jgi:hypothetical protein